MVEQAVIDLFTNVGFPVACVVALGIYLKNTNEAFRLDAKEREGHYREHQKEMVGKLGEISETIVKINDRLDSIEERVYDNKED